MQNLVGEMFETLFRDSGPAKARGAMPDDVADCAMSFQSEVIDDICEDLASHVERDPAVLGEPLLVLTPNAPFAAPFCMTPEYSSADPISDDALVDMPRISLDSRFDGPISGSGRLPSPLAL